MSAWLPALITGGLAALTAVLLALWNAFQQRRAADREAERDTRLGQQRLDIENLLERARGESAEVAAEQAALRSYRIDALKRLYAEVNPLVFQLRELCRGSSNRARRILRGDLRVDDGRHLLTSTHRLFAPAVVVQEIQRHLTVVDLRLDPTLSAQYAVVREVLWTFHSGVAIAGIEPRIDYRFGPDERRQHLTHAQLVRLADALTAPEEGGTRRPVKQTELDDRFAEVDKEIKRAIAPVDRLFSGAGPASTPVLWRLLLAHAMFLHVLADLVDRDASTTTDVIPPDIATFAWPSADEAVFAQERDAAAEFVRQRLRPAGVV